MIPLDYLVFAALALSAFLAIDLWLRRPPRMGNVPRAVWLIVFITLIAGWFLTGLAGDHEKLRVENMVEGFAPTYAQEMTQLGHERIDFDTKPDDPLYLEMVAAEMRWLKVNPLVHDIYTFKMTADGHIALLVDSETDYDHNGKYEGKRESRTPIGEVYEQADESLKKAFTGVPVFDSKPTKDRWGTWVSAFVPMFDSQGRVNGVLGVDYDASDWSAAIHRGRLAAIGVLAILLTLLATAIAVISNLKSHIGRREQAEKELVKAKQAAESANVAKGDFLANMSHEIRTPLNGVLGMIDLLTGTPLSLKQKEFLEALKESSTDLSTLLNDILDFSKIDAGKLALESVPFSIRESVEGALKPLKYRANAKGLTLEFHIDPNLPDRILGDPGRFRQILSNLVGNAIKFTSTGGIEVSMVKEIENEESFRVRLTVSDTGVGIPRHKQASIFDVFTQADSSVTRRYGGTGLGLAIVSKLVRMMDGRIWVESEEKHGSRFHVTLTMRRAIGDSKSADQIQPDASTIRPASGLEILLAEDTAVNQMVTANVLTQRGHRVAIASNGLDVLKLLKSRSFDLILMDVQMPDMDGLETTRRIREQEEGTGRHIPIIAMTAYALRGDREATLNAGMDDYISKPVDAGELLKRIDRIVASRAASASAPKADSWDASALTDKLGGDRELLKKIVAIFEEDRVKLQGEIRKAVEAGDASRLEKAAHALRGSIGNFRFEEAYQEASLLEKMGRTKNMSGSEEVAANLEVSLDRLSEMLQHL